MKRVKRVQWGYPYKSQKKAKKKLAKDLKFYGGYGGGNCARLDERSPQIIEKEHKDGTIWYHIEVDDIILPLELE